MKYIFGAIVGGLPILAGLAGATWKLQPYQAVFVGTCILLVTFYPSKKLI